MYLLSNSWREKEILHYSIVCCSIVYYIYYQYGERERVCLLQPASMGLY